MPKVSVIMSVNNGDMYLRDAIDSILNQTFRDFEFVIINDGSTDRTEEILVGYEDSRMRIFHQGNNGLTKSLNKGIQLSQGEYIARMDADDVSLPERLEKQVKFFDNYPDVALVGTSFYEIDSYGNIIGRKIFPTTNHGIRKALIKYNPFFHSSVMIRKDILIHIGQYCERLSSSQDYELWLRISKRHNVANLTEFLTCRRYVTSNISILKEKEQLSWAIWARKKAIKEKQYPFWCYLYLIRPLLVLISPKFIKVTIRKYLLKNPIYASR